MLATWGCSTFPKPTLSLDFAGATSLDSGITFSRGSQATLFDSTGTLVYAKHNLLLQSQFASGWSFSNASFTSTTVAPDGTNTGQVLNDSSAAAAGYTFQGVSVTSGTAYVFSVFAKSVGLTSITLRNFTQAGAVAFNLTGSGSADTPTGTFSSPAITAVGNGWYRCSVIFIATGTASNNIAFVANPTAFTGEAFAIWGAQFNLANMEGGVTSSLTTYYPTTTAAYYAPRFDYNPSTLQPLGLLIEESRTNSIRNNTMQGAVAGTPGTLPTNWSSGLAGLTQEVVGTGTENGITYLDVRLSGTTTGTQVIVRFDNATGIAAANGQTWTLSTWLRVVGGSTTNISGPNLYLSNNLFTSGGVYITDIGGNVGTFGTTQQRYSFTGTISSATAAFIRPYLYFLAPSAGVAIDVTLRIGLPQLELGAFATSVIPTTTTALTRNADVASMTGTNFSSWYNQTEGTFFAEATSAWASGNIVGSSDGTNNNRIFLGIASGPASRLLITTLGSSVASITVPYTLNTVVKGAGAYKENSSQYAANGVLGVEDTVCTIPTVNRLSIGTNTTASDFFLNGYIRRIAYYPTRLPNSTLQALTA